MTNTTENTRPQFPQAGIGCGGIFFRPVGMRTLRVLLASRAEVVGAGSGISFGGWMRLSSMYDKPDGTYITAERAALTEAVQEIPGLFSVIPKKELATNLQYLFGGGVYKPHDPYGNVFHGVTYFGIALHSEAEEKALCNLPKSRETSAPLRPFDLTWSEGATDLTGLPTDFHHQHEIDAFNALVLRQEHGLLQTVRRAA